MNKQQLIDIREVDRKSYELGLAAGACRFIRLLFENKELKLSKDMTALLEMLYKHYKDDVEYQTKVYEKTWDILLTNNLIDRKIYKDLLEYDHDVKYGRNALFYDIER